jgi:hypothetical protein
MAWHEFFALASLAVIGVTLVSALSPNAKTNDVLYTSWNGAGNIMDKISAPVRAGA